MAQTVVTDLPAAKVAGAAAPGPVSTEVDLYLSLLIVLYLTDQRQHQEVRNPRSPHRASRAVPPPLLNESARSACGILLLLQAIGVCARATSVALAANKRALDKLLAKLYYFTARLYELVGRYAEIRAPFLNALRTATLRHDDECQVLRHPGGLLLPWAQASLVHAATPDSLGFWVPVDHLAERAAAQLPALQPVRAGRKARGKNNPAGRAAQQPARPLLLLPWFVSASFRRRPTSSCPRTPLTCLAHAPSTHVSARAGRIKAIQLDYSEAFRHLQQAARKAPQAPAAPGFQQSVHKLMVIVQLLLGDIPERALFRQPVLRKPLVPYLQLTQSTCRLRRSM